MIVSDIYAQIRMKKMTALAAIVIAGTVAMPPSLAVAADHGDTPFLQSIGRHDARITGLYAFTRVDNLVVVIGTNPAIPAGVTDYQFPADAKFIIGIDNEAEVTPVEPKDTGAVGPLGGTIVDPDDIDREIKISIKFAEDGTPKVKLNGSTGGRQNNGIHHSIQFFSGLRDDPFIRTPRIGTNVAALVVEIPLDVVIEDQSTLLVWAYVKLEDEEPAIVDLAGRALRNQFSENLCLNNFRPRKHLKKCGLIPDVVIFNIAKPAQFPNGRELTDDVISTGMINITLAGEDPATTTNDVPFLSTFPYLAAPHP